MRKSVAKLNIIVLMIAVVLTAVFACPLTFGVADGLTFGDTDTSTLWYYGESGLKVDAAKDIVSTWNKNKLTKKTIAIIDTGISSSHELFSDVLYKNAEGKAVGYDARSKKEIPIENMRDSGVDMHGNAVAGVIAMLIKEFGLENLVDIYVIKANRLSSSNEEEGKYFQIQTIVEGINQAAKIGADVINLSLGILQSGNKDWATNTTLKNALLSASESALIVAAAGNDGKNSAEGAGSVFYPAAHDGVLSVMALGRVGLHKDSNGAISTNYGDAYDIAAVGEDIYTAKYAEGTNYQTLNGTSFASPIVAFAGALLQLRYEADGKSVPNPAMQKRLIKNLDGKKITQDGVQINCLDLDTLLTQDFENTSFTYLDPTAIEIAHDGTMGTDTYSEYIYMRANKVTPINFTARLQPYGQTDPDIDARVEWLLADEDENETSLGFGGKFVYTPNQIGKEVTMIARLRYGSNVLDQKQKIYVSPVEYHSGEVRVTYASLADKSIIETPSGGVLYTTETTVFSLTGIQFVSHDVPITWYVNGELVGEGVTFAFTPKKAGYYRISARYDGRYIQEDFNADVKPFIARPLDLSMLVVGLVLVIVVASVAISIKVKRKKTTVTENSGDNSPDVDDKQ